MSEDDEARDIRHKAREEAVRRACEVMGWTYSQSPAYTAIRAVAMGKAVAVSVEKLNQMLDRISPRPGHCEHGVSDGDWCETCNREMKLGWVENLTSPPV